MSPPPAKTASSEKITQIYICLRPPNVVPPAKNVDFSKNEVTSPTMLFSESQDPYASDSVLETKFEPLEIFLWAVDPPPPKMGCYGGKAIWRTLSWPYVVLSLILGISIKFRTKWVLVGRFWSEMKIVPLFEHGRVAGTIHGVDKVKGIIRTAQANHTKL